VHIMLSTVLQPTQKLKITSIASYVRERLPAEGCYSLCCWVAAWGLDKLSGFLAVSMCIHVIDQGITRTLDQGINRTFLCLQHYKGQPASSYGWAAVSG
jgi:hypothetical protein